MIHRLLYVSRDAAVYLPTSIEAILRVSVANNRRDGVTGLLVCDGVNFAQALEGDADSVEACFRRIAADERHDCVLVRDRGPAPTRRFARWSMCALYLSELDDALLAPGDIEFDVRRVSAEALWQHLGSLADRHAAQLDAEHQRLLG